MLKTLLEKIEKGVLQPKEILEDDNMPYEWVRFKTSRGWVKFKIKKKRGR